MGNRPSRSIRTVELLNSIIQLTYGRRKRIRVVANLGAEYIMHLSHSIGQMLQFIVHDGS